VVRNVLVHIFNTVIAKISSVEFGYNKIVRIYKEYLTMM